jgi:hypothetical protein
MTTSSIHPSLLYYSSPKGDNVISIDHSIDRMSGYTYKQEQPEAGPSKRHTSGSNSGRNHNLNTNPQLSSEPWFAYPTPPPEVLDAELPPYMDSENYPMGHMLDRLSRKAHGDLKTLVIETYVAFQFLKERLMSDYQSWNLDSDLAMLSTMRQIHGKLY